MALFVVNILSHSKDLNDMKNFVLKIQYLITIVFLLLVTINLKAQCSFTVSTQVINPQCLQDGKIIVNIQNVTGKPTDFRYALEPISPSTYSIAFNTSNELTEIPPGSYNVIVESLCDKEKYTAPKVKVNLTSTYTQLQASIDGTYTWKTGKNCATGQISLVVNSGKKNYSFQYKSSVSSTYIPVSATLKNNRYILNQKFAEGIYDIQVIDDCGYTITLHHEVEVLSQDVPPLGLFYYPAEPPETSCSMIRFYIYLQGFPADYMQLFSRESGMYEVCFSVDNTVFSSWTTWDEAYINYELPNGLHYKDFYSGTGKYIYYKIRLKGCTQTYESRINLSTTIFIDYTNNCQDYTVTYYPTPGVYTFICYPYTVKLEEYINSQYTNIYTKVVTDKNKYTISGLKYNASYRISMVDNDGNSFYSRSINHDKPKYSANVVYNKCGGYENMIYNPYSLKAAYIRILADPNVFLPGTTISVSGPSGHEALPPYTITRNDIQYAYYPGTIYSDNTIGTYYKYLVPGVYTITITDECGSQDIKVTVDENNYYSAKIGHTLDPITCKGQAIKPVGEVKIGNTNITPYFRIYSGPAGFDQSSVTTGGTLMLNNSGTYIITVNTSSNNVNECGMAFDTIVYEKKLLSIDTKAFAAYQCEKQDKGHIIARCINGVPPYTYELLDSDSTTILETQSNLAEGDVAHFNKGTAGNKYYVRVTDNCGTGYPQPITMVDLTLAKIIFETHQGSICEGGSIQLNALTLGDPDQIKYKWTYPNGTQVDDQNPVINNATPDMAGIYKVEVIPQYCDNPIKDEIKIDIISAPNPPLVQTFFTLCLNSSSGPLSATPDSGHTIQWYSSDGVSPISPPVPSTSSVGITEYYVQQNNTKTGCMGKKQKVTVNIIDDCITANDDKVTVFQCEDITIDVLANDDFLDGRNGAVVSVVNNPTKGTASVIDSKVNYKTSTCNEVGVDQFTYKVCKDGSCSEAKVDITILRKPSITLVESCTFDPKLELNYQYQGGAYEWQYSSDGVTWESINNGGNNYRLKTTLEGHYRLQMNYAGMLITTEEKTLVINKKTYISQIKATLYELTLN